MPSREARTKTIPAPMRGWVINENLAANQPMGAQVLENWFPTDESVRVRRGAVRTASIPNQVRSFFSHEVDGQSKLFAADSTAIYDVTAPGDVDTAQTAVVTQQSSGYYASANLLNAAGSQFTVIVNGTDDALLYDGSNFFPLTDTDVYLLEYDALTADFTKGQTVTGGTSAASATIVGMRIDSDTTGRLYLTGISGIFQDDETITDGATGSATANGVTSVANSISITGVATADLSYAWTFKNRLFFVEKDSLKVWFMPVLNIGGAAADLNLAGAFKRGGKVLFGATWSSDSGSGFDDRLVIVSDLGEAAVYQGSNPADPNDWALVQVYEIGKPLGARCWLRAGGDLIIGTEEGAVALSQVAVGNPNALTAGAVSRPIERDWRAFAEARTALPWEMAQSRINNWALCTQPTDVDEETKRIYVVNLKTGAWCLWTGIDALCVGERDGVVYCGTKGGRILRLDSGALDDGASYICRGAMHFDHLDSPSRVKQIDFLRATMRSNADVKLKLSVSKDYQIAFPSPPDAQILGGGALWDQAVWDQDVWFSDEQTTIDTAWQASGRITRVASVQFQIHIGGGLAPDIDLASVDVRYSPGGAVV